MRSPTDIHRPAFSLRVAGSDAPEAFANALSGWRVLQQLSRPAVCDLQFHERDLSNLDTLRLGSELELSDATGRLIFSGTITSMRREKRSDGLRTLHVRAHDALDRLRRRQAMAIRGPAVLAQVLSALVSDLGVNVQADEEGPDLPLIVQWGTNDLDWIANVCATYGAYFALAGSTLRLMSLEGSGDAAIELDPDENLFEASIESNALRLRTEASACAWNPLTTESYRASAVDFTLDVVRDWEGAPPNLKQVARDIVGGAGPRDEGVLSRVAQADLERASKRAHRFEGLVDGDARLMPGSRIALAGSGGEFEGEFALTRVEHSYTLESGYTCGISSDPPADPERLVGPAVSLGVVSDTDDPQGAGRVRVLLKAFNDAESDWLNVCSLGAGENKGFIAQPEAGDSVLIAFVNDNPAQGVVIGGLFGGSPLHDDDVAGQRPRPCTLRTRDGQLLRLDDQEGAIRLQSRGGVFDLDPDGVVLETKADLRIAAPGRHITIIADKIDFRKG